MAHDKIFVFFCLLALTCQTFGFPKRAIPSRFGRSDPALVNEIPNTEGFSKRANPSRFGRSDPSLVNEIPDPEGMNPLIDGGDEVTNAIEELFERLDHIKHMREKQYFRPGSFSKFKG